MEKPKLDEKQSLQFVGIDLNLLPDKCVIPSIILGHIVCAIVYSLLNQMVMKETPGYEFSACNATLQFATYFVVAFIECTANGVFKFSRRSWPTFQRKASWWEYGVQALLAFFFSTYFCNKALQLMDYAVRIIMGTSKVFFVMVMGVFYMHKRYQWGEYGNVLILVVSIVLFSLDPKKAATTTTSADKLLGTMFMLVAVSSDVVVANFQEKVLFSKRKCVPSEVMFWASIPAVFMSVIAAYFEGEIPKAIEHFKTGTRGKEAIYLTVIYSAVNYFTVVFIFLIISKLGAFQSEVVKSVRKLLQLLFSIFVFHKAMHENHFAGLGLFILSLTIGIYMKWLANRNKTVKTPKLKRISVVIEAHSQRDVELAGGDIYRRSSVSKEGCTCGDRIDGTMRRRSSAANGECTCGTSVIHEASIPEDLKPM
eukprot:255250_1